MGWLGPLTGILFVVVAVISFALQGEPPDVTEDSAAEIVDFYADNKDEVMFGAALQTVAATLLVFFGGVLRRVLRAAEGEGGTLSLVVFGGTVILAAGSALDATINFGLAETADDIDPSAAQALMALWNNDFLLFALGTQVLFIALGVSIVRHGAFPAWIGWISILLGVIAVTPIGFAGFIGGSILVLIMSGMLLMRSRAA
ncbi:MAG: DUF4386 family protein [Actinomycetota bacterium]|nr:DUF4386 family protein [Actinomycetota bacterium]